MLFQIRAVLEQQASPWAAQWRECSSRAPAIGTGLSRPPPQRDFGTLGLETPRILDKERKLAGNLMVVACLAMFMIDCFVFVLCPLAMTGQDQCLGSSMLSQKGCQFHSGSLGF